MRETIQSKLEEIPDLEVGTEFNDEILEEGKTYFSFLFDENYQNSDTDRNFTYRTSLVGYVKRKTVNTENTLEIVDERTDEVVEKLKELNIRCSTSDISISDNIKKIRVTGSVNYNEINNRLV